MSGNPERVRSQSELAGVPGGNTDDLRILFLTFEWREGRVGCPCGTSYPEAFQRLHPATWVIVYPELYLELGRNGFHRYIRELMQREHINVVFAALSFDFAIHMDFLRELRESAYVVLHTYDDCHYFDAFQKYLAQCVDVVFSNGFGTFRYRELGIPVQFVPPAFDASQYFPMPDRARDIDVSFVGSLVNKKGRREYIEALRQNGINVKAWGPGSEGGFLTKEKMVEVFQRSKISLDFTGVSEVTILTFDQPIHKRLRQGKGRCLEVALTGSFALVEFTPGLENYLEPETEIGVFDDPEELLAKVRYYLANPEIREAMANRAYARAVKKNEILAQTQGLIAMIRAGAADARTRKKVRAAPVYGGKEYAINYSTYRINMFLRFARQRRWDYAWEELQIFLKSGRVDFFQALYYISSNFPLLQKARKLVQQFLPKSLSGLS
jgi:spore maturation protein CgeB